MNPIHFIWLGATFQQQLHCGFVSVIGCLVKGPASPTIIKSRPFESTRKGEKGAAAEAAAVVVVRVAILITTVEICASRQEHLHKMVEAAL